MAQAEGGGLRIGIPRFVFGAAAVAAAAGWAQVPGLTGNWVTPTGSIVQVHRCGEVLCLQVVAVEKGAAGTVDANNPDASLRGRALCGLEVGSGFHPTDDGKSADGGQIYDPKNGKTYSGLIALNGADRLKLRGYVGVKLFGRTEEWTRTPATIAPCRQ